MEDLIRVRVADATEEMRIGQSTFQRVALSRKRSCKRRHVAHHHIDPARGERSKRVFSVDNMKRRPLLCGGLRQEQGAMCKVERGQTDFPGNGRASVAPLESARDHQVKDKK